MDIFKKLKDMKILLIDDDEWVRDSMHLFFENEGCHLLAVATAEEGIEALKRQPFDIIIADYKLPGMDGLSFFGQIIETHPYVIKMLITAYGNEDIASKAIRMGIHDFIEKPFTANIIVSSLNNLIIKDNNISRSDY